MATTDVKKLREENEQLRKRLTALEKKRCQVVLIATNDGQTHRFYGPISLKPAHEIVGVNFYEMMLPEYSWHQLLEKCENGFKTLATRELNDSQRKAFCDGVLNELQKIKEES